ncbi:GH15 family glucan-1,4-alpha-glucosidase [Archangium gephyra]|uniref:GH15 family glucan-1,4-alpha-glucosidase n=1 Tax=Archangium gephyra TaxID=48 RepID=A0AAC8QHQ6_9BACT|nr:glycoside hydrolase family 15 protein [Archangium gephyra]AKJ07721.1 Glucoamylase [Archangium gephyra]REG29474.1 GH15 family glucan-1,4-alpha-glucosidase [Archangium gephyra]
MPYLPVEDYGIIGDLHTVALCGINGSIDWLCFPSFDAPSVFGALLDDARGGRFQIAPTDQSCTFKQLYLPDTNILVTRFLSEDGVGEITDFMPVDDETGAGPFRHRLMRSIKVIRGAMRFRVVCRPRFDYGRATHESFRVPDGVEFHGPSLRLRLRSSAPLRLEGGDALAEVVLTQGEHHHFVLEAAGAPEAHAGRGLAAEVQEEFLRTVQFWRGWLSQSSYRGRWREMVHRSALVLKLLTYAPSGALLAAPTTSIPEAIGGRRNWDYRYTWLRDASLTLHALMRIGFARESKRFIEWLGARCSELAPDGSLQIMYGIRGEHHLAEQELPHLEGYRGSAPVRIGNEAAHQLQLDIYGALMDALHLYDRDGEPISHEMWSNVRRMLGWLTRHWRLPDEGIWEVRGGQRHFVFSKMMCWVAFDRGIRIAQARGLPADAEWAVQRDAIYDEVMREGWHPGRRAFVQAYGSEHLDASVLLMPLVRFIGPTDPRMMATLDRILEELVSDSLVYRYLPELTPDGVGGAEGTFSMCTFWLVEGLTGAGRLEEARVIFEKMLTYANHLGLYGEQIGLSGEALGNFPQAFTHLGLISAAARLDAALGGG